MQEMWVPSLGQEDHLEKEMATHSSILAEKSHGQWRLAGYSSWGHMRWTQLSDEKTNKNCATSSYLAKNQYFQCTQSCH